MTEDDNKKKKRNKKKKNNKQSNNKQSNNNNNNAGGGGETSSHSVSGPLDYNTNTTSFSSTTNNHDDNDDVKLQDDASASQNDPLSEQPSLLEAERQQWLQREAESEWRIKELRDANDAHVQKQADYEEAIKELREENDSLLQNVAGLNETFRRLQNDKTSHLQREATLEERIRELQTANDLYVQKEAGLEMTLVQFQSEKISWLEKEARLEEKIMHLEKEKESWILKEASLEEKIMHLEKEKESWILKENSYSERIAVLSDDVVRLRAQVLELEESKKVCLQENQLKEKISAMQSHIENLERSISSAPSSDEFTKLASERENLNSQIEASQELIQRLIMENAELVEKMNELHVESHHQSGVVSVSHVPGADGPLEAPKTQIVAHASSEFSENSGEQMESLDVLIRDERTDGDHVNPEHSVAVRNPSESRESGEIVQIPLDDIEVGDLELQTSKKDEKAAVPLMDAPLTGAPFRLISYFTRYVSGADLVEKNSSDSRH